MRIPPIVAAALLAAILSSTTALAGPPGSTIIVSRPAGFGPLTPPSVDDSFLGQFNFASRVAIGSGLFSNRGRRLVGGPSNTNRYHVFVSTADGLVDGDNDTVANVYVRDLVADTTTLVSRASDGTPANAGSVDPAISADGRYVVFSSTATNLVATAVPSHTGQIYERDLVNGTTTLMSRAGGAAGAVGNGSSYEPSVATDGSVAFASVADNLVGGVTSHEQVYVRTGALTLLVSVPSGTSTPGSNNSYGPSLSDNGLVVAFTSDADDIGASDNNNHSDVFVHTILSGTTTAASVQAGAYGNGDSSGASISADGHRVAFASAATNLSALDVSSDPDVYIRDFSGTPATSLISQSGGTKGNGASSDASISANGTRVAFTTSSTNLPGGDTNGVDDVYVNNTAGVGAALASRCQSAALLTRPAQEGAISPNGGIVSFETATRGCTPLADDDFAQVFTRIIGISIGSADATTWISRPTGTGAFKSGTSASGISGHTRAANMTNALSADGSVAAFVSESDELSPDDDDAVPNVFVRENKTGATELISRAGGAAGAAGDGPSGPGQHQRYPGLSLAPPSISADGRYVVFSSTADNLVPGDTNGHSDVFVRDRVDQTTTLVSVKTDGTQVAADSYEGDISADGKRVAFASDGVLDAIHDTAADTSVYVRDLVAGTTTLVSRQSDPLGVDANDDASSPAISGDGTHVAFLTRADNLVPAGVDANNAQDAYVRDLSTNVTRLGSTRDGLAGPGDQGADSVDLDFTGAHLAFESASTDLVGPADGNGVVDVFLRTLATPSTALISQTPGGSAGNLASGGPSISADGTRIAFQSVASDLLSGGADSSFGVLLRDVTAGTMTLVSRADGAAGAQPNGFTGAASLSPDGHCVAFESTADNLVPMPPGTDFTRVYMRAVDADCGTPPPVPGPSPGPAPDTTAPALTGLKLSPVTFRVSAKRTATSAKKAPKGTKIRFTLSEGAKVSLKIELKGKGRKKGKRCLAKRKTGKRCTLYKAKGTLKRTEKAGANSVAFSGRIGSKRLAKGRYRVTATATDAAGNRSKKKTATFRIV